MGNSSEAKEITRIVAMVSMTNDASVHTADKYEAAISFHLCYLFSISYLLLLLFVVVNVL